MFHPICYGINFIYLSINIKHFYNVRFFFFFIYILIKTNTRINIKYFLLHYYTRITIYWCWAASI